MAKEEVQQGPGQSRAMMLLQRGCRRLRRGGSGKRARRGPGKEEACQGDWPHQGGELIGLPVEGGGRAGGLAGSLASGLVGGHVRGAIREVFLAFT